MSSAESEPEEAIAKDEIAQRAPAPQPGNPSSSSSPSGPRNAFTELMKPKPKPTPTSSTPPVHTRDTHSKSRRPFKNRDGLGAYLTNPSSYPSSRVIYHNPSFVAIHDLYPKATVHTLLLPRSPDHNTLHPFSALCDDPAFLASVRAEAARLRALVAKELQRRFGSGSRAERERQAALAAGASEAAAPPGRDWPAEVRVGVHAHPSMDHLHVHVLSREMHGACLRHRKHYNSFNTPFLVDLADFPLAPDDVRRHPGREGYLDRGLRCWRCGREFGNRFKALKEHLEEEFEEWKAE